ncbi:glycosyltransferase family 2 protein [Sphingomonas mollis]|uniref:Glycosyltransferase family 2 protein n=1 Tax=Sphingomonas mollis TaxID=2795726 RepID=A0ABS0XNU3_9SPHN|nr:glycosyltransferase [Sphingomonas sp. BT553]MBJ6121703.1 glycosyltransferase family 2 protein [Sphingomonas sp. BT553]
MRPLSVLTLVKNREDHLIQLIEGLRRSKIAPAELIVVDMSDQPIAPPSKASFPIKTIRWATDDLPLAAARNRAARAATAPHLLFLDVDCIPLAGCVGTMSAAIEQHDALLCADIRYLGPDDASPNWHEADLIERGVPHPVRSFPPTSIRQEPNPGLFWSLAFAIRRQRFEELGGFDEAFTGYGAEDTDFGYRADRAGVPLLFVGGAIACHQYHPTYDPPVQHFDDILRNAALFHRRWGWWPMEGWLQSFESMGLIHRLPHELVRLRSPDDDDRVPVSVS